jgi:predicted dehydrogenase
MSSNGGVRVAVVGAGHWGPNLINNFQSSRRSSVAWVVDRDEARLERVRERFPDVRTTGDFGTAVGDADVDAVVIATPTSTHFELAHLALEAGKHVLVEKPLADSVERCETLCELAEREGRVLMVGHIFVYNDAARKVKEIIASGDLGRIYYIAMNRTNLGPIRVDVNAAWDLAAHDIALASDWLGSWPTSAAARGGAWINSGIADAVFATLQYPGDVLVNLHASWLNPRKSRDITVVGDQRMLTFDDVNFSEPPRIYDKQVSDERSSAPFVDTFSSFRMSVRDGDVSLPRVPMGEPLKNECEHFLDCVVEGKAARSGGPEGLAVVRTLEALSESLEGDGRSIATGL